MKKIRIYLLTIAILMGIGGAVASTMVRPGSSRVSTFYSSPISETWVTQGWPANDQNINHYQAITAPYHCDPSSKVCTWYVDDNGVIRQNEQGDFKQP